MSFRCCLREKGYRTSILVLLSTTVCRKRSRMREIAQLSRLVKFMASISVFMALSSPMTSACPSDAQALHSKTVLLPCFNQKNTSLDNTRVYWQTKSNDVVYVINNGKIELDQQHHAYKTRASLPPEQMKKGNFSLVLSNITVDDENVYKCVILVKDGVEYKVFSEHCINVIVAAHYKEIQIRYSSVTASLTCSSSGGYPEPKVYWKMTTENHHSKTILGNITSTVDPTNKLYSISSVLALQDTTYVNISCSIENV
uniref:Ig-like domain-containing protein n=1 Tax=Latimeria chalumnae TaxID=7897 RepID=M3XGI4_LATCH